MISQRSIKIASIANLLYLSEIERLREASLIKNLLISLKKKYDPIGGTYEELEEAVKNMAIEIKPISKEFVKSAYRIPVGRKFSPSSLTKSTLEEVQSTFTLLLKGIKETIKSLQDKTKQTKERQSKSSDKKQIENFAIQIRSIENEIKDLKFLHKNVGDLSREINGKASKAKRDIKEYKEKKGGFYNEKEVDKILGGIFGFLLASLLESAILDQK